MGIGIGLMSPMGTAAMNSVDRTKSGAASDAPSMSRMVGERIGVAVMGALIATLGRRKHTTASRRSQPVPAERSPCWARGGSETGRR